MNLILASQSPRRKQLLQDAAIDFEIVVVETDETFPEAMPYNVVPEHIASEKAKAVFEKLSSENKINSETLILAADTIVVLNNVIIGKPKDREDAIQILKSLSGNTHEVVTGVCLLSKNNAETFHSITKVHFNPLSEAQIEYYIDNYKPFDKAGSYAIQEWIGLIGINAIEGDLYNVIGLPINKVAQRLESFL